MMFSPGMNLELLFVEIYNTNSSWHMGETKMQKEQIKKKRKKSWIAHLAATKPLHLNDINGLQHLGLHGLGHSAGVQVAFSANLWANFPGALKVTKPPVWSLSLREKAKFGGTCRSKWQWDLQRWQSRRCRAPWSSSRSLQSCQPCSSPPSCNGQAQPWSASGSPQGHILEQNLLILKTYFFIGCLFFLFASLKHAELLTHSIWW